MPEVTLVEATRLALIQEMRRDGRVWALGEDVARGGLFGQYRGVLEEFGADRAVSTPISESTIMGAGLGAALVGRAP
jgi:pyruvate dehydrogenase E1 component beta subunit